MHTNVLCPSGRGHTATKPERCQGRRLTQPLLHIHILTVQPFITTSPTTPPSSFVTLILPPYSTSTLCTSLSALRLFVILDNCSCHYSFPVLIPLRHNLSTTNVLHRSRHLHDLIFPLICALVLKRHVGTRLARYQHSTRATTIYSLTSSITDIGHQPTLFTTQPGNNVKLVRKTKLSPKQCSKRQHRWQSSKTGIYDAGYQG